MTAKTKRLGGRFIWQKYKKMCGKTIKNTYRKLVPARLMIVLLLLGAAAVTCFILEYRIRNGQPDCWMKQNRKEKSCWKTSKIRIGIPF